MGLGRYHYGAGRSCGSKVNIGGGLEHSNLNDISVTVPVVTEDVCVAVCRGGWIPSRIDRGQILGHGGRRHIWVVAEECSHQDALGGHHDNHDGHILLPFLDLHG